VQRCKKNPILNFYINLIEMGKFIKDEIENYDYFILLRTDIDILFNFPPKKIFKSLPPSIFKLNPNYCKKWGGWGQNFITHKNYIYKSLKCFDEIFRNNKLIKQYYEEKNFRVPNQETFSSYCYKLCNFKFKIINNLNFYFTSDDFHTLSPRSKIHYSEKYETYYKYRNQLREAHENYNLFKDKYTWKLDSDLNIYLHQSSFD